MLDQSLTASRRQGTLSKIKNPPSPRQVGAMAAEGGAAGNRTLVQRR